MIVTNDGQFIPYPHVVMIWKSTGNGEYFFHTTLGQLCSCNDEQFNMFVTWCLKCEYLKGFEVQSGVYTDAEGNIYNSLKPKQCQTQQDL